MDRPQRSWWLRFLDRTNIVVTGLTAAAVLYTRSAGVAYFAAGAVACSTSAKLVKKVIRQPRPISPQSHKKTYGMPSTHSATISYFVTYITLACAYLPLHFSLLHGSTFIRVLSPVVVLPWAATILASRVWLGHHTWPQVFVGAAFGLVFGSLWFEVWQRGGNAYGRVLEEALEPYIRW